MERKLLRLHHLQMTLLVCGSFCTTLAIAEDLRDSGKLPDWLVPEYPGYDQEPSLGDYTPGDYDIPLPPTEGDD